MVVIRFKLNVILGPVMSIKIPMPPEISSVYEELCSEVTWLHGRWICYRQLFAHSPKRIDLLNEVASAFFFILQDVLLDEVQVALSKLTDPAKTRNHKNLSLEQLQERLVAHGAPSLAASCRSSLDLLSKQCEPFRIRRHKKIAHLDLQFALRTSETPLPDISRNMIEDALRTLRTYLNTIERHFNGTEWGYEYFSIISDGDALVSNLRAGLRYEELVQEHKLPHDDWCQGKWNDA